ncbi:MAG: Fur family transcriptional regulator [Candidatus Dormibacteria bacterium]
MAGDLSSPSPASAELHAGVRRRLASIRQRYTSGRRRLVEAVAGAGRPLTVSEIVRGCPTLPPSTAYRNLAVLEQATVVRRVLLEGEFSRFELSEELAPHHHHLACVGCGSVVDVLAPAELEASVAAVAAEVARATGFSLYSHRLDLIGRCAQCAAGPAPKPEGRVSPGSASPPAEARPRD